MSDKKTKKHEEPLTWNKGIGYSELGWLFLFFIIFFIPIKYVFLFPGPLSLIFPALFAYLMVLFIRKRKK